MGLRIDRKAENAMAIAERLADHPAVSLLRYPHHPAHPQYQLARRQMRYGGSIVAFEISGGKAAAFDFLNALEVIDISNNLGDLKTLACHPGTTTHSSVNAEGCVAMGITDGMIRLFYGLEHKDDLIVDLVEALDRSMVAHG